MAVSHWGFRHWSGLSCSIPSSTTGFSVSNNPARHRNSAWVLCGHLQVPNYNHNRDSLLKLHASELQTLNTSQIDSYCQLTFGPWASSCEIRRSVWLVPCCCTCLHSSQYLDRGSTGALSNTHLWMMDAHSNSKVKTLIGNSTYVEGEETSMLHSNWNVVNCIGYCSSLWCWSLCLALVISKLHPVDCELSSHWSDIIKLWRFSWEASSGEEIQPIVKCVFSEMMLRSPNNLGEWGSGGLGTHCTGMKSLCTLYSFYCNNNKIRLNQNRGLKLYI